MIKGGRIGGFGGGWKEHLRQWLGTQWPGLSPWVPRAAQSRQARPEEVRGADLGHCQVGTLATCCRACRQAAQDERHGRRHAPADEGLREEDKGMHTLRTRYAHATHTLRTHAMHTLCTRYGHGMLTPCRRHAHAMHAPCTCAKKTMTWRLSSVSKKVPTRGRPPTSANTGSGAPATAAAAVAATAPLEKGAKSAQ